MLAAVLGAPPAAPTVYRPSESYLHVLRGQSPVETLPDPNAPQTFAPPANAAPVQNFSQPGGMFPTSPQPFVPGFQQPGGDPFLESPAQPGYQVPTNPYGGPLWSFGANGPQPYKFGWTTRVDHTFMPSASATQGLGSIGIQTLDTEAEYTTPLGPAWIYSFTQEFDIRWWDGPTSSRSAPPNLRDAGFSEQFYRIGWDFELASPGNMPFSYQLGFNPSINTDFEQSITRDAWNFDGRAILFYRPNTQWTFALGAGFWDRVDDMIIPYAGAIWTPDDRWEFRLVFPEPRISYFLGQSGGLSSWMYVRGEYHVEAYETELEYPQPGRGGYREKMQVSDWRALLGLRTDNGHFSSFIEGGIVFEREVELLHGTPGFDISSGFIGRVGIRY